MTKTAQFRALQARLIKQLFTYKPKLQLRYVCLLSFRVLFILYLRPETAVPLNGALVEGNETLHTSHLQCHIFIPFPSLPLPPSLPQNITIHKGKCLHSVFHPFISIFLLVVKPVVRSPLVILCLCSVPSLPLPFLTPSASLLTWSAQPITLLLFPLPSL